MKAFESVLCKLFINKMETLAQVIPLSNNLLTGNRVSGNVINEGLRFHNQECSQRYLEDT